MTLPEKTTGKKEETGKKNQPQQPEPQQPFYCYIVKGKWDRKFRDKDGKIVE